MFYPTPEFMYKRTTKSKNYYKNQQASQTSNNKEKNKIIFNQNKYIKC
jgi:hypothetical protein